MKFGVLARLQPSLAMPTAHVYRSAALMARWALRFEERGEGTDAIIANHIIELAKLASAMPIACAITPSPSSARPMDVQVNSSPPPRPVPPRSSHVLGSSFDKRCLVVGPPLTVDSRPL